MDETALNILITSTFNPAGMAEASAMMSAMGQNFDTTTAKTKTLAAETAGLAAVQANHPASGKKFEESMRASATVLGETGGAADNLSRKLGGIQSLMGSGMGMTIGALAGAAVLGIGIEASKSAADQSDKNAAAQANLAQAFAATGKSLDSAQPSIQRWLDSNRQNIADVNVARDGMAMFVRAGFDLPTAMDAMGAAVNLAAIKHVDLATAQRSVLLGMEGNARGLKDLGIDLKTITGADDNATNAHKALDAATKGVDSATRSHDLAVQHLTDVEHQLAGKHTLTASEAIKLRDAHQKVDDTSRSLADAQGKVSDAQNDVNNSMSTAKGVLQEVRDKTANGTGALTDLEKKQNDTNRQWSDFSNRIGPDVNRAHANMIQDQGALFGWLDKNYGAISNVTGALAFLVTSGAAHPDWNSFFGSLHSNLDSLLGKIGALHGGLSGGFSIPNRAGGGGGGANDFMT